jgi:hypothetical protein
MKVRDPHHFPELGALLFWVFDLEAGFEAAAAGHDANDGWFCWEVEKPQIERPPPALATENGGKSRLLPQPWRLGPGAAAKGT